MSKSRKRNLVPLDRPKASYDEVSEMIKRLCPKPMNFWPIYIVAIRGYYRDSMGDKWVNDRGIYDDAIFILDHASKIRSFNANTDPSRIRAGWGFAGKKGMASLCEGIWMYKVGLHRGRYKALRQAEAVRVLRDGRGGANYEHRGWFGINIHRGGVRGTSSLGCQTIPPDQWPEFIGLVRSLMKEHKRKTIPYILVKREDG